MGISIALSLSLVYTFLNSSSDTREIVRKDVDVERVTKVQNVYAEQIVEKCGNDAHCAIESLRKMAETEDEGTVLEVYDALIAKYQESGEYCHEQVHHFAQFLYAYMNNLTAAMSHARGNTQ